MHLGLYLAPQTSGPEEDTPNIEAVVEQAIEASESGYSSVYLTEHHFDEYNTFGDAVILGAHLAGRIHNAWLATSVSLVTLHHPVRLVESFNLLDQLTKGRVVFGFAGGGGPAMYEGFGRDSSLRSEALEQTVDAMLRVWAYQTGDAPLDIETVYDHGKLTGRPLPAPYRKPHPYLARATNSASTMEVFAKRGWPVMVGRLPADRMGATTRLYRKALEDAGQSQETVSWCMQWMASTKMVYVGETDEKARTEVDGPMRRYFDRAVRPSMASPNGTNGGQARFGGLDGANIAREAQSREEFLDAAWVVGSPETVLRELKAYEAEGVPAMRLWFIYGPGCTHENFRKSFRLFNREVLPALNPEPIIDPKPTQLVSA